MRFSSTAFGPALRPALDDRAVDAAFVALLGAFSAVAVFAGGEAALLFAPGRRRGRAPLLPAVR